MCFHAYRLPHVGWWQILYAMILIDVHDAFSTIRISIVASRYIGGDRTKQIYGRMTSFFSDERNVLIALMLMGLIFWSYNINSPLLDHHSWRQTETAGFAKNFYDNGFNIFYPQIDSGGAGPGYVEAEFQLVPFIIAFFYKIFGVHEYVARLVIIAFSVCSIYLLYMMVRMYYSRRVAIFSAIFFITSPMELYFGRTVMPDSAMIFFSIGSLYFFDKWTREDDKNSFLFATICTTLALLVKIPTLYLGLPLLWLAYVRYGKRLFFESKLYIFAIVTLIPPVMWYYFAHSVLAQYNSVGIWDLGSGGKFASFELLLNPELYSILFTRLAVYVFTPVGLLLFIFGLSLKTQLRGYVFHFWVLATIIFFLVVANGTIGNDYYLRPLVPAGAVFVGLGLSKIYEKNNMVSFGLIAIILISAIYTAAPFYVDNTIILNAASITEKIVDKNSLIITTESEIGANPNILYYSQRKGWAIQGTSWSPAMLDSLKSQGADYFVVAPQLLLLNNTRFSNYLFNTYKSVIGSYFVIFDLHKPSDILSTPNQTDINFKGKGALIGGYIAEPSDKEILNVTSYYRLMDNKSNYYVLTINFVDNNGKSLLKEPFMTNELKPGVIMKNNYVLLLPEKVGPMVRDVQFEVQELDVQKLLSNWVIT